MNSTQQNPDGSWTKAEPIPLRGWKAKLGRFFWRHGWHGPASFMVKWDERGLGK